jgi:hypothetical protein
MLHSIREFHDDNLNSNKTALKCSIEWSLGKATQPHGRPLREQDSSSCTVVQIAMPRGLVPVIKRERLLWNSCDSFASCCTCPSGVLRDATLGNSWRQLGLCQAVVLSMGTGSFLPSSDNVLTAIHSSGRLIVCLGAFI